MEAKIIKYGRDHVHVYTFDATAQIWKFRGCRLGGNFDRCTASHKNLPRGTKFDGTTKLNMNEEYC